MRNYFKAAGFGLGAALLLSSTALAQTTVQATADLNVRSGPGPQYEVVGVIPGQAVEQHHRVAIDAAATYVAGVPRPILPGGVTSPSSSAWASPQHEG